MKKTILALLSLSIISPDSYSMYGDLLPLSMAPNHACHLSLDNGQSHCSGTIIGKKTFKTAAHCLRNKLAEETKVICPNGQKIDVKKIIANPNHAEASNKKLFDIGLVELKEEFLGEIPTSTWDESTIKYLLENSPICAVWGYGLNVNNKQSFGHYNGVQITNYYFSDSHIILPNFTQVMVRSGDSGGGLYCKDAKGKWIDIGTVYGHNYVESYLLKNSYVKYFTQKYVDIEELKEPNLNFDLLEVDLNIRFEQDSFFVGSEYKVRTFSQITDTQTNTERGIGDQSSVLFKIDNIIDNEAYGTLIVNDYAPILYLCDEFMYCGGTYENVRIHLSRLIK